jgi:hypothetical protein
MSLDDLGDAKPIVHGFRSTFGRIKRKAMLKAA